MIVGAESQCGSFHVAWGTMLLLVGLCLVCTYKTTDSGQDSSRTPQLDYSSLALPPQHIPFFLHNNKRLAKLCKEDLLCPFKVIFYFLLFLMECLLFYIFIYFPTIIVFKRAACDFITNIRCCAYAEDDYEQVVLLALCVSVGWQDALLLKKACWGYEKSCSPEHRFSYPVCTSLDSGWYAFLCSPTQRCLYGPLFGDCSQWSRLIFIVLKNWSINILLTISFCGWQTIGITWGY